MRVSSVALILAAVAAGTQAAIDFPDLRQCDSTWANTLTSSGKPLCVDGSFATVVAMVVRGAGFSTFAEASSFVTPEHIEAALPQSLASSGMTNEHVKFLESLSPGFKFMGTTNGKAFQQGLCKRAESSRSIVLLEVERDGEQSYALLSDCVDAGQESIRVMHPTLGYTEMGLEEVRAAHEFSYDISLTSSYPEANVSGELGAGYVIPLDYPLFTQCDGRWKNNYMGSKTICAVGCLISSVSMAINRHGNQFYAGGKLVTSNPGTFNSFLRANGGYQGNLFVHGSIARVCSSGRSKGCNMSVPGDSIWGRNLSHANFQKFLRGKRTVVANVRNGGHYVLAIGWNSSNPDQVLVRDPATGNPMVYSFARDIVAWRVYNIFGPGTGFRSAAGEEDVKDFQLSDLEGLSYEEYSNEDLAVATGLLDEEDVEDIMSRLDNDYYM